MPPARLPAGGARGESQDSAGAACAGAPAKTVMGLVSFVKSPNYQGLQDTLFQFFPNNQHVMSVVAVETSLYT